MIQKQDSLGRSSAWGSGLAGIICLLLLLASSAGAVTYDVGTNSNYLPVLANVPWGSLMPGDTVNIHYKPGGYHEIIQISEPGTAAHPILIRGIPDPATGALPTIDGDHAVTDPHVDFRSPFFENMGVVVVSPRLGNWVYGVSAPAWITLDSLNICNGMFQSNGITFTDQHGATRIFDKFACGIYIEFARNFTIRNCEISFNGNGIFANSNDGANRASSDLLIEKNYLHDNGNPLMPGFDNGWSEHNVYVECDRVVYQYNRFGPLRPGCHGVMIKDRSAGTVIRYNEFASTESSEILAIIDPQGGADYLEYKPYYPDAYVYGNTITLLDNTNTWNAAMVCEFSAVNATNTYTAQHRGTLYFYNNTIVNHQSTVGMFFIDAVAGTNPVVEKVDSRNNIFYTDTAIQGNIYHAFEMFISPGSGTLTLGSNWVSPGTLQTWPEHAFGATINGWNSLITGDTNGLNNPGFVDMTNRDYHLLTGANAIDAAGPLATNVLPNYPVTNQYVSPQSYVARVILGAAADLGALESPGTPGPGHLQFAASHHQVDETAGAVTLTLTRSGGFDGTVSVQFATADGLATAPVNYAATNGTVTWADGEAAPKFIQIPIVDDQVYRGNQSFTVLLSNPAGGATVGAVGVATVTILETDLAPPTVPNTPPVADSQSLSVTANVSLPITLTGHDAEQDPLTFNIIKQPTRGTLSGTPPNLTYVPATNSVGSDGFFFNVSDGKTNSATAVVQLGINYATNAVPVISLVGLTNHSLFLGPTNLTLTATASVSDGIAVVYFIAGTNLLGSVSTPPYVFTWTNAPAGTYILWARAAANSTARGFSTPVVIHILGANPRLDFQPKGIGQTMIRWPVGVEGWQLQEAADPVGPWTLSWQPAVDLTDHHAVTVPISGSRRFFRIIMPQ